MLKDYLTVAQDALSTKKELFHVKEQRLALALGEYVRLNDVYKEKSSSYTSRMYPRHMYDMSFSFHFFNLHFSIQKIWMNFKKQLWPTLIKLRFIPVLGAVAIDSGMVNQRLLIY